MKKRGISPLIATVLLIGFTIALAVIIFVWVQTFTEERVGKTGEIVEAEVVCSTAVELGIEKACVDSSGVHFIIENRKGNDVRGFVIRLENDAGDQSEVTDVNQLIKGLEVGSVDVQTQTLAVPASAFIVPKLSINGKISLCQEKAVEVFITQGC